MALIKECKTEYGINASYWRLDCATICPKSKEVNFSLGLYADKNGNTPFQTFLMSDLMGSTKDVDVYNKYFGEDKGKTYKDWQTACYMYVKENVEFFKDAEDDAEELALKNNI